MFSQNVKYEIKQLFRDRWIQLLTLLWLVLCVFAAWNGQRTVESRVTDITNAKAEMAAADSSARSILQAIEAGREVDVTSWMMPDQPTVIGNHYPRVAAMMPGKLTFVSTGQSDIYSHYLEPVFSKHVFELNFTELSSAVQLLFGNFDLSFVIIYLLPLIVIAFTYNLLSAKESEVL